MTPKSEETDTARVIQADREAAADLLRGDPNSACDIYRAATVQRIREGGLDLHGWVQAFAAFRHRLAQASPADEVGERLFEVRCFLKSITNSDNEERWHAGIALEHLDKAIASSSAASAGVRDAGREMAALETIGWGNVPRLASDGSERCVHGKPLYAQCIECVKAYARAALTARPDGGNCDCARLHDPNQIEHQASCATVDRTTATGGADREAEIDLMQMARDAAASTRPNSPWAKAVAKGLRDDSDEVRAAMAGIAAHRAAKEAGK